MTDLRVIAEGDGYDLDIQDNDLVLIGGDDDTWLEAVAQRVRYALHTWQGESVFDRDAGLPYIDGIFGRQPVEGIGFLFYSAITDVDDVTGVEDLNLELDRETRKLTVSARVRVDARVVDLTFDVSAVTP